jgi:hypothetical protein
MADEKSVRIVGVDRIDNEVVVAYSDDTSAIYGAEQLRAVAPRALSADGIDELGEGRRE